ncbi:hypothetical protein D3C73_889320 [compost metagenome]
MKQIPAVQDFARRMTVKSRLAILGINTRAVVLHPDALQPAFLHRHFYAGASGVDGILHKLLDDRSGPLHHFPRGNLVGNMLIKHMNFGHVHFTSRFSCYRSLL